MAPATRHGLLNLLEIFILFSEHEAGLVKVLGQTPQLRCNERSQGRPGSRRDRRPTARIAARRLSLRLRAHTKVSS